MAEPHHKSGIVKIRTEQLGREMAVNASDMIVFDSLRDFFDGRSVPGAIALLHLMHPVSGRGVQKRLAPEAMIDKIHLVAELRLEITSERTPARFRNMGADDKPLHV